MGDVHNIVDIHIWMGTMPPVFTAVSPDAVSVLGDDPFIPIGDIAHLLEGMPSTFRVMQVDEEPTQKVTLLFVDRVLQ